MAEISQTTTIETSTIRNSLIIFSMPFSQSFLANELEILKQIFLDKQHELSIALSKVDELTKQLDQLRKIKITTNKVQLQNRNKLDELKNEQQSRKIAYQRDVYASNRSNISTPSTTAVVGSFTSTTGYRTASEIVQDTRNNVKMAEIEKRIS